MEIRGVHVLLVLALIAPLALSACKSHDATGDEHAGEEASSDEHAGDKAE